MRALRSRPVGTLPPWLLQGLRCVAAPSLAVATSPTTAVAAPVLPPLLQPHCFLYTALLSPIPYYSRTNLLSLSFARYFGIDHTTTAFRSSHPYFCLCCHPLPRSRGQCNHCRLLYNE
ncbi:hypothetical protein B296_00042078 [Ensete ventricosum]|uniref:Uncharacterized protein n=1 Tax=Ensete ventricosum TaxID=4639 RepID=A0A426X714_ENSVE|nr:hypothetical protein B296_00042078 [Ensete ventricosum]